MLQLRDMMLKKFESVPRDIFQGATQYECFKCGLEKGFEYGHKAGYGAGFNAGMMYENKNIERGCVYILLAEGTSRIKIGRTQSLSVRMANLATASPFPLRLLREIKTRNPPALETFLKERYMRFCVNLEWFELPLDHIGALMIEDFS